MPRRKPPSAPSTKVEDPLGLEGMDSATPDPMATSSQASPDEASSEHAPNTIQASHSSSLPAASKMPDVASISPDIQSRFPHRASPTSLPDEVLQLQGVMNEALEEPLTTRTILNSHWRELVWRTIIAREQNENQAAEAIKEVKVRCAAAFREAEATIKEAETY